MGTMVVANNEELLIQVRTTIKDNIENQIDSDIMVDLWCDEYIHSYRDKNWFNTGDFRCNVTWYE